jgi:hypothetical protein
VERRVHRRAAGHPHARSRLDANVAAISIVRQAADTFLTGRSADVERQVARVLYLPRSAHSSRSGSCREDRMSSFVKHHGFNARPFAAEAYGYAIQA